MTHADARLVDYYARRASEYESVYRKPERQADLALLSETLAGAFPGMDVLEMACGTGYWTERIARSARRIVALDAAADVLAIARAKDYGACRVSFLIGDAYTLDEAPCDCTAGFHGFWWSHVPQQRLAAFVRAFHARLPAGAPVVMIDNAYVEGSSTPIARADENGNTYQVRQLGDGSTHEVLKNFPSPEEIRMQLAEQATDIVVRQLTYYWIASYRTK